MHRRNSLILLGLLAATAVWMTVVHLVLFPSQGFIGITGIGITAAAVLMLNRQWLQPDAEKLPPIMVRRSLFLCGVLGTSFTLLFGGMGAAG